jgi:hypothetical protein
MHEAQDGPHHMPRVVADMVGPLLCLIVFSNSSISQKNDVANKMGPFNIRKVPESQKHAKQENLIRSVKTK